MLKHITILVVFSFSFFFSCAQHDLEDYIGEWEGKTANKNAFNLNLTIKKLEGGNAVFTISNDKEIVTKDFKFDNRINLVLDDGLIFSGMVNQDKSVITGFMGLIRDFYPIQLYKKGNRYVGKLNLSAYNHLKPNNLRLTMKEVNDGGYTVYPMLGDFWVSDLKQEKNNFSFKEYKTGLEFEGRLNPSEIVLNVSLAGSFITKITFQKNAQHQESAPVSVDENFEINDGWESSKNRLALPQVEKGIHNDSLEGIESILVAKNGKIIYEKYFAGFDANTPHDTRSASKSISSAIIGIAIDDKIIESVDEKLYNLLPQEYQYTKDALKAKITVKNLLTMSSGLDVNKKANEGYYQNESDNWLKTVLEAPMVHEPGTYTDYGSANPFLLGVGLNERLDIPLEFYMREKLFAPLGITNYIMNTDDTGIIPYFGGGLHITPRDMLKFGQLYLNNGNWNGQQIIGGQFIFIIPELESVVVTTAGNYRNRKGNQSREMFVAHILPLLMK